MLIPDEGDIRKHFYGSVKKRTSSGKSKKGGGRIKAQSTRFYQDVLKNYCYMTYSANKKYIAFLNFYKVFKEIVHMNWTVKKLLNY